MTDNSHYDPSSIEHLIALQAIHRRPAMYIGEALDPHMVVREALCLACDNACGGCASEIRISIKPDHEIAIRDNGPGLDATRKQPDSPTLIEAVFTKLFACRDAKKSSRNRGLCRAGIVVVTALSTHTMYETAQAGFVWRQSFTPDGPVAPIDKVQATTDQWQRVTFKPDDAIFGDHQITPRGIKAMIRDALDDASTEDKPPTLPASVPFTVTEEATGETFTLNGVI